VSGILIGGGYPENAIGATGSWALDIGNSAVSPGSGAIYIASSSASAHATVDLDTHARLLQTGAFDQTAALDALWFINKTTGNVANSAESDTIRVDYEWNLGGVVTSGADEGVNVFLRQAGAASAGSTLAAFWAHSSKLQTGNNWTIAVGGNYNCDTISTGTSTWTLDV
jgi:hypothetical protein